MRFIEGLILAAILLSLLAYLVPPGRRSRWLIYLPAVAALLVVIHLLVEGYRWQMVPAYLLVAILVVIMAWRLLRKTGPEEDKPSRGPRIAAIIGTILGLLVLTLAAMLPIISPVFKLPEPSGPYDVGTRYFYWTDEDRPDEYTSDPDDFREVSIQMWYPAELSGDEETIPYMSREAARAFFNASDAPEFLLDHHALVHTHAYLGADIAQTGGPFPVITYSTSGLMSSHMALYEELASHGYVVLSIGHPYWNPYDFGPSGEVITFDKQIDYYQEWWAEAGSPAVQEARSQVSLARTTVAQERATRRHNDVMPLAVKDIKLWAEDIGFVLDELEAMNQADGFLAGALDLERAGIMGFSKGGAAAGQFCVTDDRCTAGINLTGFMYGDIVETNLEKPFFFFSEQESWCPDCYVNDLFYKRAANDAYRMKIQGARHTSFGDYCLYGKLLESANDTPEIAGERMVTIQNVFALAFFDEYLKGLDSPLLDDPSADFPEVVFRAKSVAD